MDSIVPQLLRAPWAGTLTVYVFDSFLAPYRATRSLSLAWTLAWTTSHGGWFRNIREKPWTPMVEASTVAGYSSYGR